MASCPALVALFSDYLERRLPAGRQAELDRRLTGCPGCLAFVRTFRSTLSLLRCLTDEDLPPELRLRLKAFLDDRARS